MNTKIIAAIVVIVLIAVAVYVLMKPTSPAPTTIDNSAEISSIIGEQYSSLIEEELNKLSIEQADFNSQIQDSLANDMSQFYY